MPGNTSHTFFDQLVEAKGKNAGRSRAEANTTKSETSLGEKFDARKMVIYSEIMNPKYKD